MIPEGSPVACPRALADVLVYPSLLAVTHVPAHMDGSGLLRAVPDAGFAAVFKDPATGFGVGTQYCCKTGRLRKSKTHVRRM